MYRQGQDRIICQNHKKASFDLLVSIDVIYTVKNIQRTTYQRFLLHHG